MKGIIIYGNPMWGDNERATYCELINEASFELRIISKDQIGQSGHYIWKVDEHKKIVSRLEGEASEKSKAMCSKDDTYDFETGALIALMKMCGVDKVVRACNEAFSKEMYNTYITKFEGELHELKKENNILREANKGLQEEVKRLKGESENHWKKYQRNIQKKQDRINELERAYKASNDDEAKLVEYYQREIKKLEAENEKLKGNVDELFESEQHTKSELGRLYFEKHRLEEKVESLNDSCDKYFKEVESLVTKNNELIEENEKLKLDCEKLQHGYNDMMFCGGRQNGKQYTFLVDLFKKIDQKKVDAAYKEAYNTELPVWQKEALKQIYDIHKESKEKTELPRTLDINGAIYRKSIQIKDFGVQIKPLRPLTKREKMWNDIKNGKIGSIKVEKAFINDFLSEAEENGLVWANGGEKPTEWGRWENWRRHDYIVFRIWNFGKTKELTWGSPSDEKTINYLPPMRWDLFKKGRLAVKVDFDNYKEFYEACKKELGRRPLTNFACIFTVSICKDDGFFEIFTIEDQKKNGKKIVDWEDVK